MRLKEVITSDTMFEVVIGIEKGTGERIELKRLYTMTKSHKDEDIINGNRFNETMKNKIAKRFTKAGYKVHYVELSGIYFPNKAPYNNMEFFGQKSKYLSE